MKKLSLHDFKNWLSEQDNDGCMKQFFNISGGVEDVENPYAKFIGNKVKAKVSQKKLTEKVETEDDAEEVVFEFLQEGGTIIDTDGKMLTIETESGQMKLPRFCVKIRKED